VGTARRKGYHRDGCSLHREVDLLTLTLLSVGPEYSFFYLILHYSQAQCQWRKYKIKPSHCTCTTTTKASCVWVPHFRSSSGTHLWSSSSQGSLRTDLPRPLLKSRPKRVRLCPCPPKDYMCMCEQACVSV
jgi:hypothetical protein